LPGLSTVPPTEVANDGAWRLSECKTSVGASSFFSEGFVTCIDFGRGSPHHISSAFPGRVPIYAQLDDVFAQQITMHGNRVCGKTREANQPWTQHMVFFVTVCSNRSDLCREVVRRNGPRGTIRRDRRKRVTENTVWFTPFTSCGNTLRATGCVPLECFCSEE